jgi:rod shape-determining protein MreD
VQNAAIVLLGFFLLVAQSTFAQLVPFDFIVPYLVFPIVLYMGIHDYNASKGALLSFALGYLMDVFSGSPMGLYTFVTVALFLMSRMAALRLFMQGFIFEIVLTFVLTLVTNFLVLSLRMVFEKDFGSLPIYMKIIAPRAVATAVVSPAIFGIMRLIEKVIPRRRSDGKVLRA